MVDPEDITPALERVGREIRHRTRENKLSGGSGGVVGTFTEFTTPDDDAAALIVADAAREVAMLLGQPGTSWTGDLDASAADVVAILAALKIEQSYGTEGSQNEALMEQLGRRWRETRDALLLTAKNNQTGGWRFSSIRSVTSQAVLDEEEAQA